MDQHENALVAAVIARLRADATVAALVGGRVWDEAPDDADFPQLRIGRGESRPVDADGGGVEQVLTITGVSRFAGAEEGRAITAAVRACLHNAALSADGVRVVSLRVTYA